MKLAISEKPPKEKQKKINIFKDPVIEAYEKEFPNKRPFYTRNGEKKETKDFTTFKNEYLSNLYEEFNEDEMPKAPPEEYELFRDGDFQDKEISEAIKYNVVFDKIKKEAKIKEKDLQNKIEDKIEEMKGLISEYGALLLVSKEYNINVDKEFNEYFIKENKNIKEKLEKLQKIKNKKEKVDSITPKIIKDKMKEYQMSIENAFRFLWEFMPKNMKFKDQIDKEDMSRLEYCKELYEKSIKRIEEKEE